MNTSGSGPMIQSMVGYIPHSLHADLPSLPMNQYRDHQEVVNTANREHLLKSGQSKFMSRNLFQLFAEVLNKIINFLWVSTKLNRADIGTKALQGTQFQLISKQV